MLGRLRDKHLHWLGGYAQHLVRKAATRRGRGPRHLLFALADHHEPLHGQPTPAAARERVRAWHERYPALAAEFRDADGHPPRHSFFYPGDQYAPEYVAPIAELCARGLGEVELHLHHDGDTAEKLRADLLRYLALFAEHGHLTREGGRPRYAFIHGDWCLANSREDRRFCGVDAEIPLLFDTGCYADFTFPSAPDETQPRVVNRIYWPSGDLHRARAYEQAEPARVGVIHRDRILMVTGPLALARVPRPGHFSFGIEAGHLTAVEPANQARVRAWVAQGIHVRGRPEWVFCKVHTHGSPEPQANMLLGDGGRVLHRELARYNDGERWILHYVTAREMFNIAIAAMDGQRGNPHQFRDYVLAPPPCATAR